MVTQSPVKMFPGLGMRENFNNNNTSNEDLSKELGMMLREQRRYEVNDRERELNLYRSGSAPPTVEGSLAAVGGFFNQSNSHTNHTSEEEIRSDPEYLSYYYRNVNMNPRLPPPILSKEDWRLAQRMKTAGGSSPHGGIGDRRRNTENRSLFSQQPGLPPHHAHKESCEAAVEELQSGRSSLTRQPSAEWFERGSDGLIGLSSGGGLGARRKSLADMLQEDLVRPSAAPPRPPSRPASRNAFDADAASMEALRSTSQIPSLSRVQSLGSQSSHGFASALAASLSRNQTPEPQPVIARSPSPCPPGMGGRFGVVDKQTLGHSNSYNGVSSSVNESVPNLYKGVQSSVDTGVDLAAKLSGIKLSCMEEELHGRSNLQDESLEHRNYSFHIQNSAQQQQNSSKGNSEDGPRQATQLLNHSSLQRPSHGLSQNSKGLHDTKVTSVTSQMMADRNDNNQYSRSVASNFSSSVGDPTQTPANISRSEGGIGTHTRPNVPEAHAPNYGISGYPLNPHLPSMMSGYGPTSGLPPAYDHIAACLDSGSMQTVGSSRAIPDLQSLYHLNNQMGGGPQMPIDPLYIQYLQRATAEYAAQMSSLSDPSGMRNYMGGSSYLDFLEFQKAYMAALFNHQKSQYGMPYLGKGGNINAAYYANPSFGLAMPFVGSPIASPILPSSPVAPASPPFRSHDRSHRFPYGARNSALAGSWNSESGFHGEDFSSSLLEEFKSNKTRSFELSEIAGHVFEFSSDQHGSRFIQQKLEGATEEDKNIVFEEIFPHALDLMTDVFGNYVIQKFFEHGTPKQRKDLANQLTGHIVDLSLQMYGCRVIQKAIEVVDDDQKAQMVLELDGHVMRCVRDQNGNHVIQKCIECIPQEKIQFIISSFLGQVVALSTHAYGCRVIQRVLEHCTDSNTQSIMMDEIMQAVCPLAEDQYGNYVVQHVLEHGKPHERTAVIRKLAGQIVQMSRQKFASNVVEKCLVFGSPAEREILIVEMLGSTDENEPLQEMMKDQFANYVVQKVLETCDDQQRELILSRIRVHLNALKKYTFGKHIVARVEKLVTAGEKRSSSGSRSDQP